MPGSLPAAAEAPPAPRGKVVDLARAIREHVEPGATLHLAGGIGGPSAAIAELMRAFSGRRPGFTLVQSTVCGHALNLLHAGLVRELVCAVAAEISGSARPSAIVHRACDLDGLVLSNWSLLSLQQRLMAGAFGLPFMPTRSLLGSDLAAEHAGEFAEADDPFGTTRVGLVRALVPDLSIVHGCIADPDGNTVLAAPAGEDVWGALASRRGVIVTVERIVTAEELRRHAALVRIPAHRVLAVCAVPLGLHPFALPNPGLGGFAPYEMDRDFLRELGQASRDVAALDRWIDTWVRGCGSHAEYLERLGEPRIAGLRRHPQDRPAAQPAPPVAPAATCDAARTTLPAAQVDPQEAMLLVLAREIAEAVRERGHRVVLAGAGVGATAAFLAYFWLRARGHEVQLLTGNGQLGYTPVPGESILGTQAVVRSATMLTDTVLAQGVLVGGGYGGCLAVLGAGQVDRSGAINSSRGVDGRFLVGSGGANDALNASEVIVVLNQSRDRFVERLAYRTGPGDRVRTVVSSLAVFRKDADGGLRLTDLLPRSDGRDDASALAAVREGCGWPIPPETAVGALAPPTADELAWLRWLRGGAERPPAAAREAGGASSNASVRPR